MSQTNPGKFKILIVDDNPKNIQVVGNLLSREGYPTAFALGGEQALDMVKNDRFDLILLDVMMPETDGFDVCERLKKEEKTKAIPIIFLTAKTDADSIVKGFDTGAYDYVAKPFISRELLARVRTQLYLKSLNDELTDRYEKIKRLESARETLTSMIVHDLRNPLTVVMSGAELLGITGAVSNDPAASETLRLISNASRIMLDMTIALLDVAKFEAGEMVLKMEEAPLRDTVEKVMETLRYSLDEKKLSLHVDLAEELPPLRADREVLRRILVNILGNAIRFAPWESGLTLSAALEGADVRLMISDEGPGIPEEYHDKIFDKFSQVEMHQSRKKYSTGLGLTFCKMAVEAHGGCIGVESELGKGSRFWMTLPLVP